MMVIKLPSRFCAVLLDVPPRLHIGGNLSIVASAGSVPGQCQEHVIKSWLVQSYVIGPNAYIS
jgi:hypothetical protein